VPFLLLKFIHVLGAVTILGTGAGIAFFMLAAHLSGDRAFIAATARTVVVADFLFTATAVVIQPITGMLLASEAGYALTERWLLASVGLYALAGAFWLPVVWIQMRLRALAEAAVAAGTALPAAYHRLFRLWFAFGIPGFGSTLLILWLMIARPSL